MFIWKKQFFPKIVEKQSTKAYVVRNFHLKHMVMLFKGTGFGTSLRIWPDLCPSRDQSK